MSQYAKASSFSGASSPVTSEGDLIVGSSAGVESRLAIGANGRVLQSNGSTASWEVVAGTGDVVGPASATDHAIARYDLTTGKLIQDSVVIIADTTGNTSGVGTLSSAEITSSSLTPSRVLVSGTSKEVQSSSVSTTTLGYLDASSSIQTQLDAKIDDVATANDNEIPRFDTNGQALQNSGITIDDSDNMAGVGTISSGSITIGGDVVLNRDSPNVLRTPDSLIVDGDLTVSGTTVTLDTTNLQVEDANILINKGAGAAPADDVSGLSVERGATGADGSLVWNETANRFSMGLVAGEVDIVDTTSTQTLSSKTFVAPALGTPASGVATNLTGTASGLTAGNVTTNANSTGDITSVGNATTYAGTQPVATGGTGATTATAGFDALSPMTTQGDIIIGGASGTGTRLAAVTDNRVVAGDGTNVVSKQIDDPAFFAAGAAATDSVPGIITREASDSGTTYSGETWNGTDPTTGTYHWDWVQVGKKVTLTLRAQYTGAGTSNSQLYITLPTTSPLPVTPNGGSTNNNYYVGSGGIGTSGAAFPDQGGSSIYLVSGTNYRVYVQSENAIAATHVYASITYVTDD